MFHLTATYDRKYSDNHDTMQCNCFELNRYNYVTVPDKNGTVTAYRERPTNKQRCAMREYILSQAESLERTHAFPTFRRIVRNWWKRRSLRKLEDLDEHILMDIGLTRADLILAQKLPLDVDPISEIGRQARLETYSRGVRHK